MLVTRASGGVASRWMISRKCIRKVRRSNSRWLNGVRRAPSASSERNRLSRRMERGIVLMLRPWHGVLHTQAFSSYCGCSFIRVNRCLLRRPPLPLRRPAQTPQIGLDPACLTASSPSAPPKASWNYPDGTPGR